MNFLKQAGRNVLLSNAFLLSVLTAYVAMWDSGDNPYESGIQRYTYPVEKLAVNSINRQYPNVPYTFGGVTILAILAAAYKSKKRA
jgi:hypothetical protein